MTTPDTRPALAGMDPHVGQVLSASDHAILGSRMATAGMSPAEIGMFLGMVENAAAVAARDAARQVALAMTTPLLKLVRDTHDATAQRILNGIQAQTGGLGIVTHRRCVQIAQAELISVPRHLQVDPNQQ